MSEPDAKASAGTGPAAGPEKPQKPRNPVWRMMGLPNFRAKLPSRNWSIFLGITGAWTAAVIYDRREKKRIQRKWSQLVADIALEPIDAQQMPRKLSIYIEAPPFDGLVPAREHFTEYIKPILVAAALDWDAVEGRMQGDVRAGLAERIRRLRMKRGERGSAPATDEEESLEDVLEMARQRAGVKEWDGIPGDIVVGRHAWKEYVRGLHEGWLGPLDPPALPVEEKVEEVKPVDAEAAPAVEAATPAVETPTPAEDLPATATVHDSTSEDDASPAAATPEKPAEEAKPAAEESKKPKKKKQPPPFNTTADYPSSQLSPNCPQSLGPVSVVPLPHLLGFFNFPIRMYRFLNRRQVADDVGREVAAAVLAAYRPFEAPSQGSSTEGTDGAGSAGQWEQERLLANEEAEWHKSVRDPKEDNGKEKVWTNDMVLDPRIAERMRKFVLEAEAEEKAKTLGQKPGDSWIKSLWPKKAEKKAWEGLTED